jgi:hypothetical protein
MGEHYDDSIGRIGGGALPRPLLPAQPARPSVFHGQGRTAVTRENRAGRERPPERFGRPPGSWRALTGPAAALNRRSQALAALLLSASLLDGSSRLRASTSSEVAFEMRSAGFAESEIGRVESGGVAARLLSQGGEDAPFVVGVVRISAPQAALVDYIANIGRPGWHAIGSRVLQAGRFGIPPRTEDLASLVFERQDIQDLKRCRVGDCDVQVSRGTMELAHGIDWRSASAEHRAQEMLRSRLLGLASTYLQRGALGMAVYDDGSRPEPVANRLRAILANSPDVRRRNPPFFDVVLDFPHAPRPASVEDFLFWSKVSMLKPVVSIVHGFVQRTGSGAETRHFIALKHIYDSHCFLAYTEFLTLLPAPETSGSFYLIRSVRAVINPPRGWLRGLLLGRIRRAMRKELTADLIATKQALESNARSPVDQDTSLRPSARAGILSRGGEGS